jgi:cysteine desulfurase / selenocysteine lyase
MIYLDNAATSHPKPSQTRRFLNQFIKNVGGNPGRGGHSASVEAARIIFETREKLTAFVNGQDSERMIFTQNGTESLNLAILGLIGESDHVITTSMEHNSVMRPLTFLQKERNVEVSVVQCSPDGQLDALRIKALLRKDTKAVIVNHGSNVTGTVQSLNEIRRAADDVIFIVDACQTIGSIPIDVEKDGIDVLCFSCHKSLYALQGVGAIYMRNGVDPRPLRFGGTGSNSESLEHPSFLPDKYESGTPNTPGIATLFGGLAFIEKTGMEKIMKREKDLIASLVGGLKATGRTVVYGRHGDGPSVPVVSFNITGKLPSEVGYELNRRGIYVRVGLHCAPQAHRTIGTFPHGAVRVSPGYFTTKKDIAIFLEAVKEIAEK